MTSPGSRARRHHPSSSLIYDANDQPTGFYHSLIRCVDLSIVISTPPVHFLVIRSTTTACRHFLEDFPHDLTFPRCRRHNFGSSVLMINPRVWSLVTCFAEKMGACVNPFAGAFVCTPYLCPRDKEQSSKNANRQCLQAVSPYAGWEITISPRLLYLGWRR